MAMMGDMDLVREYALHKSEESFTALVSRHINLVYSVALRQVGNTHQAEEITQTVFVTLARRAGTLSRGTILSGWLFQTARLTAANFVRTQIRRTRREQEAYMQSRLDESGEDVWQKIGHLLNDAISGLAQKNLDAIVVRFIEGRHLKEVSATLGITGDAAKKRVPGAVEKLRAAFSARGAALSGEALTGAIGTRAV